MSYTTSTQNIVALFCGFVERNDCNYYVMISHIAKRNKIAQKIKENAETPKPGKQASTRKPQHINGQWKTKQIHTIVWENINNEKDYNKNKVNAQTKKKIQKRDNKLIIQPTSGVINRSGTN